MCTRLMHILFRSDEKQTTTKNWKWPTDNDAHDELPISWPANIGDARRNRRANFYALPLSHTTWQKRARKV